MAPHGWSYVKCEKCSKKKEDLRLNNELQTEAWKKRIIEGDPMFGREALNKLLNPRGIFL